MRTVFVFPATDLERVREQIARLAREGQGTGSDPWVIDVANVASALYVSIDTTADDPAPLYCDWTPSATEELRASIGHLPAWAVVCDVSGRIPGDDEVRTFVLEMLTDGGVATDDYSDHCWTAAEIAEDHEVDGLKFFDHRTSYERWRERGA